MNIENSARLAGVVEMLIDSSSRSNEAKPRRYWYPLSMASYGVDEIIEAIDSMCSFRTTMWEKTLEFERHFANYQGCSDAVMVNSGSSADLLLAFLLTNPLTPLVDSGTEVLVPIVTWPTQIWSLKMAGFRVRFVDIDPATLNIDLDDLEAKITPHTRAVSLVHLMGNPCDMGRILSVAQKNGLVLLEDCCEAMGSEWDGTKVGNFGAGGSFSFFFSHHMTTMEGGMVVCPNGATADQVRIMRAHGWLRNIDPAPYNLEDHDVDPRYSFVNWGFNVRPTELQAGFGLHQLRKVGSFNQERRELAGRFFRFIDETEHLQRPVSHPMSNPCWFALPMLVAKDAPFSRNDLTAYLEVQGVETRPIVAGNLARHPVAKLFPEFREDSFPGADTVHTRGFYVGLLPGQTDSGLDRLIECLHSFLSSY